MTTTRKADMPFGLSLRELEIIRYVAKGLSNGEIAGILKVSENTIKKFTSNIFTTTGQSNRVELVIFAMEQGLVPFPGKGRYHQSTILAEMAQIHQRIEDDVARCRFLLQRLITASRKDDSEEKHT